MKKLKPFWKLLAGGFAAWLALGVLAFVLGSSLKPAQGVGLIGDMFGGASSLFAAFGALGVVYTLNRDRAERSTDLSHRNEEIGRIEQARREAIRPFVSFEAEPFIVDQAQWVDRT